MASLRSRLSPRVVRLALVAGALAALVAVAVRSKSLLPQLGELSRPDAGWLLLALLAQVVSLGAYALLVQELLRAGDVVARVSALLRATVAGIAMGASLPGGQVASAAYWYKQLRREGASASLAAYAMAFSMLAGVLSLAGLLVAGVAAAGGEGPLAGARTPLLVGCAGALVLAVVLRRPVTRAAAPLVRRVAPRLPAGSAPGRRSIGAIAFLAFANWLFDCACLYASLAAVHAHVPLQSILLTYTLAQLVAAVPVLPGGGGTVEASLVLGFAGFQHTSTGVLAGVLLYRLLCCWGLVPIGWLAVVLENRRLPLPRLRPQTA